MKDETCGGCFWLKDVRAKRHTDVLPRPGRPLPTYKAGTCRRFPTWEEKRPETPACGEFTDEKEWL